MEDKGLIIGGTLACVTCTILAIIFAIKMFQVNLFCAIFSIVLCIGIGYFDAIVIKYFINKIKSKRNDTKN